MSEAENVAGELELSQSHYEQMMSRWSKDDPKYGHYWAETNSLLALFNARSRDDDTETIHARVCTLNAWYKTRLSYAEMDSISETIFRRKDELEAALERRSVEAVEIIRHSCRKDTYSFASKYCHMSRPDSYPIYDGLVRDILLEYNPRLNEKVLRQYDRFCAAIDELKARLRIKADCHHFDLYLWMIGKERDGQANPVAKRVPTMRKVKQGNDDSLLVHPCGTNFSRPIGVKKPGRALRIRRMEECISRGIYKDELIKVLLAMDTGVSESTIRTEIIDGTSPVYCPMTRLAYEVDGFLRLVTE